MQGCTLARVSNFNTSYPIKHLTTRRVNGDKPQQQTLEAAFQEKFPATAKKITDKVVTVIVLDIQTWDFTYRNLYPVLKKMVSEHFQKEACDR